MKIKLLSSLLLISFFLLNGCKKDDITIVGKWRFSEIENSYKGSGSNSTEVSEKRKDFKSDEYITFSENDKFTRLLRNEPEDEQPQLLQGGYVHKDDNLILTGGSGSEALAGTIDRLKENELVFFFSTPVGTIDINQNGYIEDHEQDITVKQRISLKR